MTEKAPGPPDNTELAARLGHTFATPDLLEQSLTHASHGRRGKKGNNERLEFMGDRVLGLVVATWLYELFPAAEEGDLARRHASLVSRDTLARIARDIGLGPHIRLAKTEGDQAERANSTILADTLEAIIAALFLDGGLEAANKFIRKSWQQRLEAVSEPPQDSKTALQEWAQAHGLPVPAYAITGRSGPPHAPMFEVAVTVAGYEPARATGSARQKAEKAAAMLLLQTLQSAPPRPLKARTKAKPAAQSETEAAAKKPRKP